MGAEREQDIRVNRGSGTHSAVVGIAFLLSLLASGFVFGEIAQHAGLRPAAMDGTAGILVFTVICFIPAATIAYIVGNVIEGHKLADMLAFVGGNYRSAFKSGFGALAILAALSLVVGILALAVWAGWSFVATTPVWAIAIIVLLLLILAKKQ